MIANFDSPFAVVCRSLVQIEDRDVWGIPVFGLRIGRKRSESQECRRQLPGHVISLCLGSLVRNKAVPFISPWLDDNGGIGAALKFRGAAMPDRSPSVALQQQSGFPGYGFRFP